MINPWKYDGRGMNIWIWIDHWTRFPNSNYISNASRPKKLLFLAELTVPVFIQYAHIQKTVKNVSMEKKYKNVLNSFWNPTPLVRFCMLQKAKKKMFDRIATKKVKRTISEKFTIGKLGDVKETHKSWKCSSNKSNTCQKTKSIIEVENEKFHIVFSTKFRISRFNNGKNMHFISIRFVLCHQIELMFCWNLNSII